jgi:K+-transporting ATPase KdpF subunit
MKPLDVVIELAATGALIMLWAFLVRVTERRVGVFPRRRPEADMTTEAWIALVTAAVILAYLIYTLLRPEKF